MSGADGIPNHINVNDETSQNAGNRGDTYQYPCIVTRRGHDHQRYGSFKELNNDFSVVLHFYYPVISGKEYTPLNWPLINGCTLIDD